MYNNDHIDQEDLRMRAILGNAQEEVPAHVWDGIAAGLDKAAMRKKTAAWLWRSVAGVAAAAVVAVGVMLHNGNDSDIVPAGTDDMIAVVQDAQIEGTIGEDQGITMTGLDAQRTVAYAHLSDKVVKTSPSVVKTGQSSETHIIPENVIVTETFIAGESDSGIQSNSHNDQNTGRADQNTDRSEQNTGHAENNINQTSHSKTTDSQTFENIDWEEDDKTVKKIRTSFVLSGVAGTNTPQQGGGLSPLKGPAIFKSPTKTTVESTSADYTYGIPLSFGAGVKLHFTKRWSLGMGLNYTLLSCRFSGKYTKVEDNIASLPVSAKVRNAQHYVGIPVNAYYDIVSRDFINLYAYAGGAVEKCVRNSYEVQTTPVINHSENVGGVQLSANAGIGVEFMLGRYVGLYLDPSLRYYFNCKQPKSIRTAQPLMLGFEMGLRFKI